MARILCFPVFKFFTDALLEKDWVSWAKHYKCVNAMPLRVVDGGRISIVAITLSIGYILDPDVVGKMGKSLRYRIRFWRLDWAPK